MFVNSEFVLILQLIATGADSGVTGRILRHQYDEKGYGEVMGRK